MRVRILAVDTSSPQGSVSLLEESGRIQKVRFERSDSHLVELSKIVSALLSRRDSLEVRVDRVAVVTGPGSFTGLRVGMAFVKGLYAAGGVELVTMGSLDLLAHQASPAGLPIAAMIDARRDEVYAAFYPPAGPVAAIAPRAFAPGDFLAALPSGPAVFIGSGAVRYRTEIERAVGAHAQFAPEEGHALDTSLLCRLAAGLMPLDASEVDALEPFYIRPSDVKLGPLRSVRAYDRT
jgi:tRNA threonylcarbamoyladenosine biosynthesis protein TsaB